MFAPKIIVGTQDIKDRQIKRKRGGEQLQESKKWLTTKIKKNKLFSKNINLLQARQGYKNIKTKTKYKKKKTLKIQKI